MISFAEARQLALEKIGPQCGLLEDQIQEKPYGWYFSFQSKDYIATGDDKYMLVGGGGFIVEREDGRIFEFGAAYSLERNLAAYEAGFKYEKYDLVIHSVFDVELTVKLLSQLRMVYVIPELENGTVWKIPRQFTKAQLKEDLQFLPHTFSKQSFSYAIEVFHEIGATGCCMNEVKEHRE